MISSDVPGSRQEMVKMSIFSSSASSAYDFLHPHNFREDEIENPDIPIFSLKSIAMATTNFSNANKLGKGLWACLQGAISQRHDFRKHN